MTDCECKHPGFCERHGVHKSAHLHHLCQTNEKYFAAWEAGRGPGQGLPEPGTVEPTVTEPVAKAPVWEVQQRLRTCAGCKHYMGSERCTQVDLGCLTTFRAKLEQAANTCPLKLWAPMRVPFITCADLGAAAVQLAGLLPGNVSRIVGIPRSGMAPAAIIASLLHRPLYTLRDGEEVPVGGGYRAKWGDLPDGDGIPVYVDDTTHNGNTLRKMKLMGADLSRGITAVCFALDKAEIHCWAVDLPTPHLLEWNIANAPWASNLAIDLDGVICYNPPWQSRALYPFRAVEVRSIVTARPESERAETEQWLQNWGIRYRDLVMWQGTEADRWNAASVGKWKAHECLKCGADAFIESEPDIADVMRTYGVRVLCPRQGYLE